MCMAAACSMMKRIVIPFAQDIVAQWHFDVATACESLGEGISDLFPLEKAEDILEKCLEESGISCYFSLPANAPIRLPKKMADEDVSLTSERQRWSRKVIYYLTLLEEGLSSHEKINHFAIDAISSKGVGDVIGKLKGETPTALGLPEELAASVTPQMNYGAFSNFFVSYIDPLLYTCLVSLNILNADTERASEPSHAQRVILEEISKEVNRCICELPNMQTGQRPFADEANLWWGIRELLYRSPSIFSIGESSGEEALAKACRMLIGEDAARDSYSPEKNPRRLRDITPEIYDERRTKLFVLKNCLDIADRLPCDADTVLQTMLPEFAMQQFDRVANAARVEGNLYRLGLALFVSSRVMEYVANTERHPHEPTMGIERIFEDGTFFIGNTQVPLPGGQDFFLRWLAKTQGGATVSEIRKHTKEKWPHKMVDRIHKTIETALGYRRKVISKAGTAGEKYKTTVMYCPDYMACRCDASLPLMEAKEEQNADVFSCALCDHESRGTLDSGLPEAMRSRVRPHNAAAKR